MKTKLYKKKLKENFMDLRTRELSSRVEITSSNFSRCFQRV